MFPSNLAASWLPISGSKSRCVKDDGDRDDTVGCVGVPRFPPPVAARGVAALGTVSVQSWGRSGTIGDDGNAAVPSLMKFLLAALLIAKREPCRRSDAGFPRMSNWERRCIRSYFNSSWNESPFLIGSAVVVCWPESHF
jgi:hypothetical protein